MKRVKIVASALPAAIGLAVPLAAPAAAATAAPAGSGKRASALFTGYRGGILPRTVTYCYDSLSRDSCFKVSSAGRNGNWISHTSLYNWYDANGGSRWGRVGYKHNGRYGSDSTWKSKTAYGAAGTFLNYYWKPGCSFPASVTVIGKVQYHSWQGVVTIRGNHWNGSHWCY